MTHDPKVLSEPLSDDELQYWDRRAGLVICEEPVAVMRALIAEVRAHRARSRPVSREEIRAIILEHTWCGIRENVCGAGDAADAIITLLNGGKDAE